MATLGELLFFRAEYRIYNTARTDFVTYGEDNFYLPYADPTQAPSTGDIVTTSLITSLYSSYLDWMEDFALLCCRGIDDTGNSIPNENFSNYFPNIKSVVPSSQYIEPVLVFSSGKVLQLSGSISGTRAYATVADYVNDSPAMTYQNDSVWGYVPGGGSAALRGHCVPLFYTSLDSNGDVSGFGAIRLDGMGSSTNRIAVYSVSSFVENFNNVILYCLKDAVIPVPTPSNDPYSQGGESDTGGGTGDFDGTSVDVDFTALPTLSAVDTGFITLYNPSLAQLQSLASYMWSGLFDLDTFKKLFADPMQAILGLSIVPGPVPNGGTQNVRIGNIDSGISMTKALTQYIDIDCGTLNVEEFWGAYLDYEPYTKAEIFLPFIGVHQISIDDIMNKAVQIKYHIDLLSGGCACEIKCGGSVLYTFIGSCAVSIPVTGSDWTNLINGVLSAASAIGTMVATGGASAPAAVSTLASTAVNSLKPSIEKSGSIAGAGGLLAGKVPVLILTRPRQALPGNQNAFTGYPAFITRSLGSLSGYTEVHSIRLSVPNATEAEIDEIEELLKGGVIL